MSEFATPNDERNWAMYCHLSALAMFIFPFGNIIGPLILWSMKKDHSALVDREGKKALNFQISMSIYLFVSAFLIIIGIGILLLIALGLVNLIFVVMAVVKTLTGEDYEYPLSIKILN
ncbi:DUF4870 domain-containing protein [Marinifilum sp.]|uniref:DUF4870 domain-containing protein n=1 Tax=Marinifilum sp. TaxID=2033137 RepID=UPI003BA9D0AA